MFANNRSYSVWNARFGGGEALIHTGASGYKRGPILGRAYLAHRVAWAIYTGEWPVNDIDHINMDPADNRIANLRHASRSENCRNKAADKDSTSQYRGVHWRGRESKWYAQISINGRCTYLGAFIDERAAAYAYDAAAKKHHGKFARLNFPT